MNVPQLDDWEACFNSLIVKENSSDLYKNLQLLAQTNNIQVEIVERFLNPAVPDSALQDPNFYRLVLGLAENCLALSQFENFNEILRFFLSIKTSPEKTLSFKSMAKLADAFFTSIKSKPESEIPYVDLLIVYDNLIENLVKINEYQRLLYISNSLLSLGSRCKQAKLPGNIHLEYWRRSVSIELDLENKSTENSTLLVKAERLCLALIEINGVEEAFEIISDTIGFYANKNLIEDKVKVDQISDIWGKDDIQRIMHLSSRLLIDSYPKVSVAFSNLNPEVEASALEYLLEILAKSSRANKMDILLDLVKRIIHVNPFDQYPLRLLRVLHTFFKSTGTSYEKYNPGITENLLRSIKREELAQDMGLAYSSASIVSVTSLSLVISLSALPTDQISHLNIAVQYMLEALNSKIWFSENLVVDAELLSYFLDLQGAHETRAEFLRGVIKSHAYKGHRQSFSCYFHLDLISSLLLLGYTGAAAQELEIIKSQSASLNLKPVDQVWLALREADYYIAVSDLSNASKIFNKICTLIEQDELLKIPLLSGRPAFEDRQHFQNRATLFAEICYALAKLHIEEVSFFSKLLTLC